LQQLVAIFERNPVTSQQAKEIEDAVYDLKAVNPHRKPVIDSRTPEELISIIETKGKEVAQALAELRATQILTKASQPE
jgi:hypothetical protein